MNLWLLIICMGLITFALRLVFIAAAGRVEMASLVQRGLKYVPAAVLSAIVFPELLYAQSKLNLTFDNERLFAGLVAIVVAWRTQSVLLTLGVGMAALWLLQFVFSGGGG